VKSPVNDKYHLQGGAERPFLPYRQDEHAAMKLRRAMQLSLFFIFIGFIGGTVRYWRWWPSDTTPGPIVSGILCPLCPNIDGVGLEWDKFVNRVFLGGLLNIVPALLIGWLIVGSLAIRNRNRQLVKNRHFTNYFARTACFPVVREIAC
jgi:hypothetical protein